MKSIVSASLLAFVLGMGTALAQNPAPAGSNQAAPAANQAAPAANQAAPAAKAAKGERSAVSKACSDQADAKGLRGKARKKFRQKCKHDGGKES